MTIKSVDMQVLMQKVNDIARIKQVENSDAQKRQQEFNKVIDQETRRNSKTIKETSGSTHKMVKNDEEERERKRRQNRSFKDNKNETKQNEEEAKKFLPDKGKNIDFTV